MEEAHKVFLDKFQEVKVVKKIIVPTEKRKATMLFITPRVSDAFRQWCVEERVTQQDAFGLAVGLLFERQKELGEALRLHNLTRREATKI